MHWFYYIASLDKSKVPCTRTLPTTNFTIPSSSTKIFRCVHNFKETSYFEQDNVRYKYLAQTPTRHFFLHVPLNMLYTIPETRFCRFNFLREVSWQANLANCSSFTNSQFHEIPFNQKIVAEIQCTICF